MSNEIETWQIIDYKATVSLLLQQQQSKFRMAVTEDTYHGESGVPVNQLGPVVAQKKTTRHADTPLIETPHVRRWVYLYDYEWADLIDSQDKLRVIADPTSPYAINGAMALRRAMDDEIISGIFGVNNVGEKGATPVPFPSSQIAPTTAGGLTIAKLREAKQMLMAAEVDVDTDKLWCAITARQHDDLLGQTQAISLDYTNKPVLVDGRIKSFMGFNFIDSERLPITSTDRKIPCWAQSGVHLGVWDEVNVDIGIRRDKSNSMQVYVKGTFGATRLEEKKVVQITCSEA